jgi:peptidyl-dipeptidase A
VRPVRNLALISLLVACNSKPPVTVPAPPPSGGDPVVVDPPTEAPKPAEPPVPPQNDVALVAEAPQFIADVNKEIKRLSIEASLAEWANQTDITPAHEDAAAKANAELAKYITKAIKSSRKFEPVADKLDPDTRRMLLLLKFIGQPAPDDPKQADELAKIGAEMTSIYGKGKACVGPGGKDCKGIDDASKVLQQTRDPKEALAVWQAWHDSVGRAVRKPFVKFVGIANAGAQGVGFKDVGSMWKSGYDMPEQAFEAETDRLWNQMKPLYDQLHCYTRRKLNGLYGDPVQPKDGPIMAHLTGNMWGQSWTWLYKELEPYKGQVAINVTPEIEKNYDEKKMVKVAETFYTSLGMPELPATFWERSQFAKPQNKEVVCHASAWDVTYSADLRIKMCIQKTQEELEVIHHELGHNYYQLAYVDKPLLYMDSANDGFHEAIGDTIALSMTPSYYKERGLLKQVAKNEKVTINQQMLTALEKIAFLPFGLVIDKWRWDVFAGKVKPEQYNEHWWKLRKQYQGIAPAIPRTAADFDAGAKYHVPANVAYTRYFLARVLQFQLHRSLCKIAGHKGPLHECSIYKNKAAGAALWKLLQAGKSKPWQETLFDLTGQREMDATALLEYFAPLKTWLEKENKGQSCGW